MHLKHGNSETLNIYTHLASVTTLHLHSPISTSGSLIYGIQNGTNMEDYLLFITENLICHFVQTGKAFSAL